MPKTFSSAKDMLYICIYEDSVPGFSSMIWSIEWWAGCCIILLMSKKSLYYWQSHADMWQRSEDVLKSESLSQDLKIIFILKTLICKIISQANCAGGITVTQRCHSNSNFQESSLLQMFILKSFKARCSNKIWLLLKL